MNRDVVQLVPNPQMASRAPVVWLKMLMKYGVGPTSDSEDAVIELSAFW